MKKIKKQEGFTLIELLVVIAIIAMMASITLASLNSARMKARDAKRLAQVRMIRNALELYRTDNGRYPFLSVAAGGNGALDLWVPFAYAAGANQNTRLDYYLNPASGTKYMGSLWGADTTEAGYADDTAIMGGNPAGNQYAIIVRVEIPANAKIQTPASCTDLAGVTAPQTTYFCVGTY